MSPVLDSMLLVIEPTTAAAYAEAQRAAAEAATPTALIDRPPVSDSDTSGIAEPGEPAYYAGA